MKTTKNSFIAMLLAVALVISAAFPAFAQDNASEITDATFSSVIMNIGADETMRNITWYSNYKTTGEVRWAKASEMTDDNFPADFKSAPATVINTTNTGYYSYKATMSGLEENTDYVYCLAVGSTVSAMYSFTVNEFGDDYSFVFISDPQVSTYGGPSWSDTLQKIEKHFPDTSFIVSGGDQLETPTSEVNYDNFIVDETANTAIAITLGTSHDNAQPYKEHYNLPNLSSTYGVSEITSDYYYTYNSTLFMHINIESDDVDSHAAFVERTVKNNPDCIWQIVVIHYSLYSGANYDKETTFRNTLTPKFSELGIDAVLSGHHHFYARSELMSDVFTVSEDVITDNTVTDPTGTLYIDAGPASTAPGFTAASSAITDDYTLKQDFEARKKIVEFSMTETSLTMNAYYMDADSPELFDTFTIFHSVEKVRLNSSSNMLELSEDGARIPLVDAYAYDSATVKAVNGYWSVSVDGGTEYSSLGIKTNDTDTVLVLNEATGSWELSEDGGASFIELPVNINRYTLTYVTEAEPAYDINLSDYPTHNIAADQLPDDVALVLPQGSIEDGVLHEWEWKYYTADGGDEVTVFSAGEEYVAYLNRTDFSVSNTLYLANTTNSAEGIYTWNDAWSIIKRFSGTDFTLVATEDITLSASDAANLALPVNVTVDLAGYTIDSTAVSNMIILDQGTSTSNIKIITSQNGGTLESKAVFFLSSGAGTTLNLTLGSDDSKPVTVRGSYLANADNNFKTRATLNLKINGGTYELTNALIRIDNYRPEEARRNYYYADIKNADISIAASPLYFRGSGYSAHAESTFTASNTSFTYTDSSSSAPFFSTNDWYGTATFNECSFNGINFAPSCADNSAGVVFGAGCSFKNSDTTFNSEKTAFASDKVAVAEGKELIAYDNETMLVYDPETPLPPDSDSVLINVAAETNSEKGTLSWSEAWALVNTNTTVKYYLRLTENITLASTDAISLPVSASVNTILDLAGFTLNSTALSRMFTFGNNSTKLNSNVSIITSKTGGVLTSKAVFYLTPGTGDTINLTFGGKGSRPISVNGTYLADSTNNFKNGSALYLNVNEGTYDMTSLFDVDNYRDTSEKNNYYVTVNGAKISTTSSPVVFKDTGYCAGSASTFTASDSTFTYSYTSSPAPFFAKAQWNGSAKFTSCSFNGISFAPSYVQSVTEIIFSEGCSFKNSADTFNSDTTAFASEKLSLAEDCKLTAADGGETILVKKNDEVTIEIRAINGNNININGSDKGAATIEDMNTGSVLKMSSSGDGEFLYWIDTDSNTILSYDEIYTFTVGSDRSIAAIYTDNTDIFVTFTSMGNKFISAGLISSLTVPENPYVYGYKFDGWYTKGGGKTSLVTGGSISAESSTEYVAGFIKDTATYTVTVDGIETLYSYNEKVTATAESEKDSKTFSCWKRDGVIVSYSTDYSFYVNGDTTVESVYGESIEGGIVLAMATPVLVDGNKIAFFAERDIPSEYTLIESGILIGTNAGMDINSAPIKVSAKSVANKGQFTIRKADIVSTTTYYGKAYAIYSSSDGSIITAYSNEVSYYAN